MGKPTIKLVGEDGNAFAIMTKVRREAKNHGFSQEKVDEILEEMMSGDYNNLLATACKYFDVQ